MRRRDFFTLFGGSFAWPLVARAQPRDGIRRLGVLLANHENDPVGQGFAAALVRGLGALGWREGGNLRIDWRWTGGDPALFERYAGELVALGPDALFAQSSPSVVALRKKTATIPIVFAMVTDPIGQGFVASLAHPGGNVTGFSDFDPSMAGKWLGMLTQITPPVGRIAVLYNPATTPHAGLMRRAIEEAAPSFAVTARIAPCGDDAEIETTMTALAREQRAGLLVLTDIFTIVHRDTIIASAARHRMPAVYFDRSFTAAGGLMSYGIDYADLFYRSATYVDRILNGAKATDLPVQQPTKFELVINLKTAKAQGIEISPTLLATADEAIE
ncbi:ABC transporter substrate-binding protein [Bradyrhizobium canariense]|uniref:Putative ABC transport system substrate-binding protein n=1 Tax=Bradyrhizobium canariense TaxID=255045 RepID=A0A1H2BUU4_9BRAD|nr:ABC transporter substrate-binding protein [Bradyrhizobium canariense]SDT61546.1 putative ABC transport system substrate-binding protein [Bradyrhizobium canariense]